MARFLEVTGFISEISRNGGELTVEWEIPDFLKLSAKGGDCYGSPDFYFNGACWCLNIYSNGDIPNKPSGFVVFELVRRDEGPPMTIQFTISITGEEGVEKRCEYEYRFSEDNQSLRLLNFLSRYMLKHHDDIFMPDDDLIVRCIMKHVVPSSVAASGGLPSKEQALVRYSYKELETATQNFAGRYKIGEGGFGIVFKAVVRGDVVAIKRLKNPVDRQFITELKTLTKYKHKHLLSLLGCSPGRKCCLVYKYIPNGSLEDRLACEGRSEPLPWQTRLSIAYGSALGINHLHTFQEQPVVHRDIKSANILLDENFVPKVGDFGLVRAGDSSASTTEPVTATCCGTRGYMPREALLGDVSIKWDTFSFGVVLLELLTGLPPSSPSMKGTFLIIYMEGCKDIIPELDSKAKWNKNAARELYSIAQSCLLDPKRSRPAISEILGDLRKLSLLR